MAESWNILSAATAAEPAASPDDGGDLPSDPTTLDLDQLMNLRLRDSSRQDPDDALKDRERTATSDTDVGDDVARNDDLPADLTTLSLGDLMNLRVRASQQEDDKDDEKTDDDELTDPQDNGEEPTEAQLIAAEDAAAAAAAAAAAEAGETEVAQNADENSGEGADAAPPRTSGGDGTDTGTADLGQTVQILPAELAYVAALQVANTVPSAPVSQPVPAPAPVIQQIAAPAPPPPPAPAPDPPSNVTPVAGGDRAALNEDSAVVITVLGNDTDADGDPLQVAAVTQGQHGHVAINIDGTLTYTPVADYYGTDTFTYTISDGRGGTSTATVSLAVQPVNDAPVATDDAARTDQGQPVTLAVLANDSDVDGDVLSVTAVGQGANGKVAVNSDGTLTYFPAARFFGTDSFTYTVSDGNGGSTTGTVSVQVNQANTPPTAGGGLAAMETDTPISGTLTATDANNASGELSFSLAAGPANGKVDVQADGTYTYAPAVGFSGTDSFTFTVTDPDGASDSATVTVTVLAKDIDPGSGGDIGVNTTTAGAQQAPAMTALSGGGFVVTWESAAQDGSGFGIFAQRFDAAGRALGSEFQVNAFTQNAQQAPATAALSDGGFVIVWESQNQDGSNKGIFAQRFDAGGRPVGPEVQVNTTVKGFQEAPDVAALANGGFVVTWQSQNQDGSSVGVFAQRFNSGGQHVQRFDSAGQADNDEFQVNTFTAGAQEASSVAVLSTGGFVVVWQSQNQDGSNAGIYGQRYAANGRVAGREFQVNASTLNAQQAPDVAALAGGGFVAVWQSQNQDGNNLGIFGQRFDANGVRIGGEFQINTETVQAQQTAAVIDVADGGFVAVWQSVGQDAGSFGVFGQRFDANGAAIGQEFQVNVFEARFQGVPDVAVLADGSLVVSWQSTGQDGASQGVFARVFDASVSTGHAFNGGPGNDSFIGGAQADKLSGGGGDDILIGGAGDDGLDGGAGNDRLDGALGVDQLFGGSGDDILLWDPNDAVIDGGTGLDTLEFSGGLVNLGKFSNKIDGIDVLDLASNVGANQLILNAQDILDIADDDILAVLGDARDSVNAGTGWTAVGSDGQGNDVYTQSIGFTFATLIVDSDILLNGDILF